MAETLRDRQLQRELRQVDMGVARYRKNQTKKEESDLPPGKELVKRAVEPTAAAIEEMIEKVESGKAGRGKPAAVTAYLTQLQAEPVAYITARACINAAANSSRVPKTAMSIATLIEEHYQFDELREAEPALASHMEKKAKKWSTSFHRRAIMRRGAEIASVTGLPWKQGDKLRLGMKLIELFIEATGLVEEALVSSAGKRATLMRPTPETEEWLKKMHGRCELLEPRFTPMVCPPNRWTTPIDGGYLTRENRTDFIGGVGAELRDDAFSIEMRSVYDAVNSVQETRWRINRAVFDVLEECWKSGDVLGGLPSTDPLPIPERPSNIPKDMAPESMDDATRERFENWRREAASAHDDNARLNSKRLAVISQLSMASDLRDEDAIYFPHNVDFRGRIYPLVTELSPQADDIGKSLLEFADGKPLGACGGYWLCVHIANLFGIDKCSFDERVAWTEAHHDDLMDSAFDPLDGNRFWTKADDPWCALAACFEYAGMRIEGRNYVSHLPIAMDGSCSGLQHFSAMLKDKEGGREVNLLPSDEPSDVYTAVANAVEVCLNDPDLATNQLAQAWKGMVTRKIVKRPCMTFAYSVTSRGMRDQILDEMRKQANGGEYLPGWDNFEAANFIAPMVEQSIRDTVDRAAEAMDWLKDVARELINAGVPFNWFTPDGFPVQHRYMKTNGKRFNVWFKGSRLKVQLRVETEKPDLRKHTLGVAPNFVHSMDATHLRMVVNRMASEGITDAFAMIHDSFGVHACDIDELHYAIRDEFIRLYTENRLEVFKQQQLEYLPEAEFPPVPEPGELDLEAVRQADFFFA